MPRLPQEIAGLIQRHHGLIWKPGIVCGGILGGLSQSKVIVVNDRADRKSATWMSQEVSKWLVNGL